MHKGKLFHQILLKHGLNVPRKLVDSIVMVDEWSIDLDRMTSVESAVIEEKKLRAKDEDAAETEGTNAKAVANDLQISHAKNKRIYADLKHEKIGIEAFKKRGCYRTRRFSVVQKRRQTRSSKLCLIFKAMLK